MAVRVTPPKAVLATSRWRKTDAPSWKFEGKSLRLVSP